MKELELEADKFSEHERKSKCNLQNFKKKVKEFDEQDKIKLI